MTLSMRNTAVIVLWSSLLLPVSLFAQASDAVTRTRLTEITSMPKGANPGTGFVPTALAEARVAATQAGRAAKGEGDLAARQQFAADVLHAIDPALAKSTLGGGVGVRPALQAVLAHLQTIVASDAKADVQRTVPAAVTATQQLLRRCDRIVALAKDLQSAVDLATADTLAAQLAPLTQALLVEQAVTRDQPMDPRAAGGLQGLQFRMALLVAGRQTPTPPVRQETTR